jgi:hypothetical protein
MKITPCHARNLLATSLLMLCAACGGQPPQEDAPTPETVQSGNFFMGTQAIYGHLVNNKDGSWVFTTITALDDPTDTAYLVRLNDLTPAFDIRVAECAPQVYPGSHRCNPASPFRDEDSGVLDKIINGTIALGTAGKITDISYAYETTFDETAFNQAVDEALVNSGLDRRRMISLLTTYADELREARAELQVANERMQALRARSDDLVVEVHPTIGGLTDYYQGDIDFTQLIDLEAADDAAVPAAELEANAILPCDARKCVAAIDAALAALRFNLQSNREHVAAGMRPSSRTYNVHCNMASYGSYLLQAECPAQIIAANDQPVQVPINITILSRDFDDLYPTFDIDGQELRISIDGQTATFSNTTSEYLSVSAQTVYYNSTVHTTVLPMEIPPGISITRDLKDFVSQSIDIESRYLQMTPEKAGGASFRFGFAVRYQLASQPQEQTLHDMETFNVGCVIKNRMRPGSCQPQSMADASVPNDSKESTEKPHTPM